MVYTLEMMEHPVKTEVVGGKFLGKSMILSMNKPSLNSGLPYVKVPATHGWPPTQRLFCCARDLIPVLARTQARRCCIPPGLHHKKVQDRNPREWPCSLFKKYILTSPASTGSLSSECFFFLVSIILLYRQHRPMLFWTTRPYHRTKMNHRMVVVVPLRNTMGWQLERIPKAMPMGSSQVG